VWNIFEGSYFTQKIGAPIFADILGIGSQFFQNNIFHTHEIFSGITLLIVYFDNLAETLWPILVDMLHGELKFISRASCIT